MFFMFFISNLMFLSSMVFIRFCDQKKSSDFFEDFALFNY